MCVPLLGVADVLAAADCVEVVVDIELPPEPGKIVGIRLVCALVLAAPAVEDSSTLVVAVAEAVSVAKLLALSSALLTTALGIGVPASPHANCNGMTSMLSFISLSH